MGPNIQHIIVLMLENRSFDHMLGFMDHPNPAFGKLTGSETNPWYPGVSDVPVSKDAQYILDVVDPDHSHEAVMRQLLGVPPDAQGRFKTPYNITK